MNTEQVFENNHTKIAVLITISFCIISTIAAMIFSPYLLSNNVIFYYFPGTEILEGNVKNIIIPNAPFTNAILFALTDDPNTHMKIISILSSTGIVLFTFFITKQIFNSRIAIITTIIIAVYAGLHRHAYLVDADIFAIFLLFVSFYFITKKELNSKQIVLTSIFVGLSFIIKYPAGIIGIAFVIYFLIYTKPRIRNSGLFLIVCFLVISPLLIFNYIAVGEFSTSNSSTLVLMEWNGVPTEWYGDKSYEDSLLVVRDVNLLLENFSNNMYNNIFNVILNFKLSWNNLSVFPMIPFLGMVPLFGGIYFLRKKIPNNLMPFIISFLVYIPIMSIYASATNPIRLFPPALIIMIFAAIFFSKIQKKKILVPVLIVMILMNLGASTMMANWLVFDNSSIAFWENKELGKQELYEIGKILSKEKDIESKYVMSKHNIIAYHANSNFISLYEPFSEGDLEEHITRKNWSQYNIYFSNMYSHPQIKGDVLEEMVDYLVIEPQKNIPDKWTTLYQSEKFAIYKISKDFSKEDKITK